MSILRYIVYMFYLSVYLFEIAIGFKKDFFEYVETKRKGVIVEIETRTLTTATRQGDAERSPKESKNNQSEDVRTTQSIEVINNQHLSNKNVSCDEVLDAYIATVSSEVTTESSEVVRQRARKKTYI